MNAELSAFSFFCFYFQFSTMPLGNDVITQAQSQAGSLPGGFGGKEGLKYFIQYFLRNTTPIIRNFYLNSPTL